MATRFTYPMSAFDFVFRYISEAPHLRISIPDDTVDWLSNVAGDTYTHAHDGTSPQEELIFHQEHRRLFYMLLRIVLPDTATETVCDVERFESSKNQCVDSHQFEDAARWLHKRDAAFEHLAAFVVEDSFVTPNHLQQLFDQLERERAS